MTLTSGKSASGTGDGGRVRYGRRRNVGGAHRGRPGQGFDDRFIERRCAGRVPDHHAGCEFVRAGRDGRDHAEAAPRKGDGIARIVRLGADDGDRARQHLRYVRIAVLQHVDAGDRARTVGRDAPDLAEKFGQPREMQRQVRGDPLRSPDHDGGHVGNDPFERRKERLDEHALDGPHVPADAFDQMRELGMRAHEHRACEPVEFRRRHRRRRVPEIGGAFIAHVHVSARQRIERVRARVDVGKLVDDALRRVVHEPDARIVGQNHPVEAFAAFAPAQRFQIRRYQVAGLGDDGLDVAESPGVALRCRAECRDHWIPTVGGNAGLPGSREAINCNDARRCCSSTGRPEIGWTSS